MKHNRGNSFLVFAVSIPSLAISSGLLYSAFTGFTLVQIVMPKLTQYGLDRKRNWLKHLKVYLIFLSGAPSCFWPCINTALLSRIKCSTRGAAAAAPVSNPVRCAPSSRVWASRCIPVIGDWNAKTGAPTGPPHPHAPWSCTGSHPSPGKSNAPPVCVAAAAKMRAGVNGTIWEVRLQTPAPPRTGGLKRGDDTTHSGAAAGRERSARRMEPALVRSLSEGVESRA